MKKLLQILRAVEQGRIVLEGMFTLLDEIEKDLNKPLAEMNDEELIQALMSLQTRESSEIVDEGRSSP